MVNVKAEAIASTTDSVVTDTNMSADDIISIGRFKKNNFYYYNLREYYSIKYEGYLQR